MSPRRHDPERIYYRGEAWVECTCGATVTCPLGAEFGHEGHSHSDACLPLTCPRIRGEARIERIGATS